MAEIIEINRQEDLAQYRMAWKSLFPRTFRPSFFHTYEWFDTYWKHAADHQKMRVLVVQSEGTTIGILPLCVARERHRLQTLRVLTYPLSDWGMWYGPVGQNRSATMFMALRHIYSSRRDWDVLDLRWTPRESAGDDLTGRAIQSVGWRPHRRIYQQGSAVRFAGATWEEYLASLGAKTRQEVRRQQRALSRLGRVEFERHRPAPASEGDGDPHWKMFDECVQVSRASWQARVQTGNTLCHSSVLDFLTDCHRLAARLGMLDMAVLRLNGAPIAFQYNYRVHGDITGLRMGYSQEHRSVGAGKVLLSWLIEDSFRRGDTCLDLGPGDYDFKRRLRTETATSWQYTYYPWSAWRSHGVRFTHWVNDRLGLIPQTAGKPGST